MEKTNATAPAINVIESEKNYKVEVAAPGMTKDDFNIHLGDDNELVISMEKKVENEDKDKENKKYLRREFSYTKFQQSLYLPDNVDKEKISANVSDGVLTIRNTCDASSLTQNSNSHFTCLTMLIRKR